MLSVYKCYLIITTNLSQNQTYMILKEADKVSVAVYMQTNFKLDLFKVFTKTTT